MIPALFRIIIVEDDAAHAEAIKRVLIDTGIKVDIDQAGSIEEYQKYLSVVLPDIALIDLNLPDGNALELLTAPPEAGLFPILVMTGLGDELTAVEAMKSGAIDYVVKSPVTFSEIPRILVRALRQWRLISERKNAEKVLLESERRYRRLVENVGKEYFFYLHGTDGVFTYLSPSITPILGYSQKDFMSHYAEYLTDNPINKKVIRYTELAIQGCQQKPYELEIYHKEGSRRMLEVSEMPILDEQGSVVAVEGIAKDITERKRITDALKESEQNYRTLADSGQALIWGAGTDKLCNYFNQTWLKFTGRTIEQEMGNGWTEGVHPDDLQRCVDVYVKAFDQREAFSMEYRLRGHDGSYYWIQDDGCPRYDHEGNFIGYIGYCLDISARKRAEDEVRHSQTMLIQANKMSSLGLLVSGVAHEVSNPNKFIKLNSSFLAGAWKDIQEILDRHNQTDDSFHIAGLPYEEMKVAIPKLLSGISDGSQRINNIVERLREFSREDRSSSDGIVDINESVRRSLQLMDNYIQKHTNNFSTKFGESLPLVSGSSQQIEQVVINLVQNALQALKDRSGAITVRTEHDAENRQVIVEVLDTGIGIPEEVVKRVTEPFFTTKFNSGGTGLGLSISLSIIKDHHGLLEFRSEEGKGTTVRIVLPERAKAEQ